MGEGSGRLPAAERRFRSEAVDAAGEAIARRISDRKLAAMFASCLPNTLDTTVEADTFDGEPDTFVVTGDIEAMWLRDSTAQVWPYLRFAREDAPLRRLLEGVIRRQVRCILLDPYANAFNAGPTGGPYATDFTVMRPELHERKWELDSLCFAVRLAHGFWQETGEAAWADASWQRAMESIVETFRAQQRREGSGPYSFRRTTDRSGDTLPLEGFGNPGRPGGLIHSGFRPSDDACVLPFHVPGNFMAVVSLRQLATLLGTLRSDETLARECRALADEVERALRTEAAFDHPRRGRVLAYEVDGFGGRIVMDDANVPSLLALPYLGAVSAEDPLYRATRQLVLSEDNPYFARGRSAEGIGSPHTGRRSVWPIAIMIRALTATDDGEIHACLRWLRDADGGTGFMHESFDPDEPSRFTRPWFAWANSLFGELILELAAKRPALLESPLDR